MNQMGFNRLPLKFIGFRRGGVSDIGSYGGCVRESTENPYFVVVLRLFALPLSPCVCARAHARLGLEGDGGGS